MKTLIFKNNTDEWQAYSEKHNINNKDFKYFSDGWNDNLCYFICVEISGSLAGITKLGDSFAESDALACFFVSIKKEFRGQGASSLLVREMYKICKQNDKALRMSSYSHEGFWKLRPKLLKLEQQFQVELRENSLNGMPYTEAEDIFLATRTKDLGIFKHTKITANKESPYFNKEECLFS